MARIGRMTRIRTRKQARKMFETKLIHSCLSNRLIKIAFTVHNELGPGLLERCYQEAYCLELHAGGITFESQKRYEVFYKQVKIGDYIADILVDHRIILELKSAIELHHSMDAQIINYLRLSKCRVGYLMNFHGSKVVWKRFVL
jgi:GxxExxY protein